MSSVEVVSTSLGAAEEGVSYIVITACSGGGGQVLRHKLFVDDVETSSGTWQCGNDTIYDALEAEGGERVSIRLDVVEGAFDNLVAMAEVVPA